MVKLIFTSNLLILSIIPILFTPLAIKKIKRGSHLGLASSRAVCNIAIFVVAVLYKVFISAVSLLLILLPTL